MADEGTWIVRTYRSGNVGEKIKWWVPGPGSDRVRRRDARDLARIEKKNRGQAVKVMARMINGNFGPGDILLGLDYDDDHLPQTRQAARHRMELAIRRVRRAMEKDGAELRYIAVTSDLDGDTGEEVRLHHHLVIGKETLPYFREKWHEGGVHWSELRDRQGDYTPVAGYLLRQVRGEPEERKFIHSRNLHRPAPKDRVARSGAVLRAPRGTQLLYMSEVRPYEPQYIRYVFRE